jgi:hypothetical protein
VHANLWLDCKTYSCSLSYQPWHVVLLRTTDIHGRCHGLPFMLERGLPTSTRPHEHWPS